MAAELPPPVRAAIEAANAADIAGFLAAFTPDGVVDDWGREFQGATEITSWSDGEFIGVGVTLEVLRAHTERKDTTVKVQVGGNGFNGPSTFTFQAEGDRVARMTIRA